MRISTQNIACSQRQMYTCIHHSQLYIKSTQPVNKAAEHLINSTPVLEKERKKETKKGKKAVNANLIKSSSGGGGGGEGRERGHYHKQWGGGGGGEGAGARALSQTVGRIELSELQSRKSVSCNYRNRK